MKAFVIKNKKGKYLGVTKDYSHYWTDSIFHSYRFMPLSESHDIKAEAEEYRDINYPSCEVVPITIAEGDLEQQLAEKDEEIEELKTFNAKNIYDSICHALNMQEKQIHKQVCDEIRDYIDNKIYDRFGDQDVDYLTIDLEDFEDLLQDLEQW